MQVKVISWNMRRATAQSEAWDLFAAYDPDIALLQEVNSLPDTILSKYNIKKSFAVSKNGNPQKFSIVVLSNGDFINEIKLKSEYDWVDKELDFFAGNFLAFRIRIQDLLFNVISAYCPAWPVDEERIKEIDVSEVKLVHNPKVWATEILWAALKNRNDLVSENWIVAGDFNSSATFDHLWPGGPHGNQEIIDRMNALGLTDCLAHHQGELTPTFRNPRGGKIIHQMDHMYVNQNMLRCLSVSETKDSARIFGESLSDHLPIYSVFEIN